MKLGKIIADEKALPENLIFDSAFSAITTAAKGRQVIVLTDSKISSVLKEKIPFPVITIEPGEKFKTIETATKIWEQLVALKATRETVLVNFGGGVITDLGGFIAATYMRGIPCIQVPTTLLSMIDASLGGKNGVDFGEIKNLIGTISLPEQVIIDLSLLKSLPLREFVSGTVEMIKHALLVGEEELGIFNAALAFKKPEELQRIIARSISIKHAVVSRDPKESLLRRVLNLGHTIGHALEADALSKGVSLLHGEAVAAGLILECKLAEKLYNLPQTITKQLEKAFTLQGLKSSYTPTSVEKLLTLMRSDKKRTGSTLSFALPVAPTYQGELLEVSSQYGIAPKVELREEIVRSFLLGEGFPA